MKTAEQWVAEWLAKPADEHVLLVSEVLKIQADALRHAASLIQHLGSSTGDCLSSVITIEADKLSARSDSQAK